MTLLQQMAFDRVGNINEEAREVISLQWDDSDRVSIPTTDFNKLRDLLYEQQNWIEALWEEERKDGCEEQI